MLFVSARVAHGSTGFLLRFFAMSVAFSCIFVLSSTSVIPRVLVLSLVLRVIKFLV